MHAILRRHRLHTFSSVPSPARPPPPLFSWMPKSDTVGSGHRYSCSTVAGLERDTGWMDRLLGTEQTASQTHPPPNPAIMPQTVRIAQQDLQRMTEDWSDEEQRNQRRLVKAHVAVRDSTVEVSFTPSSPGQDVASRSLINCLSLEHCATKYLSLDDFFRLLEAVSSIVLDGNSRLPIRWQLQKHGLISLDLVRYSLVREKWRSLPAPGPWPARRSLVVLPSDKLEAGLNAGMFALKRPTSSANGVQREDQACDGVGVNRGYTLLSENEYSDAATERCASLQRIYRADDCHCWSGQGCDAPDAVGCINRSSMYECSRQNCPIVRTSGRCHNQRFARPGRQPRQLADPGWEGAVEVFRTATKGRGLRATRTLCPGDVVAEYVGEVITKGEADDRARREQRIDEVSSRVCGVDPPRRTTSSVLSRSALILHPPHADPAQH